MQRIDARFHLGTGMPESDMDEAATRFANYGKIVSRLMYDRHALREICAPRGFGRSSLARSYCEAVFSADPVIWILGDDPEFLCALDEDMFPDALSDGRERYREEADGPVLYVVDDLGHLDSERAMTFSTAIDEILDAGDEIIVVTTPSNDCLGTLQPDRVLISAIDLVLSNQEMDGYTDESQGVDSNRFSRLEGIPSLKWMDRHGAIMTLLEGLAEEALPSDFMIPALFMLLIGQGTLDILTGLGIPFDDEVRAMFIRDYPLFGLKRGGRTFSTVPATVEEIVGVPAFAEIIEDISTNRSLWRLAASMVSRGDAVRALEVTSLLGAEARMRWMGIYGWIALDRGQMFEIPDLVASPSRDVTLIDPDYLSLRAWSMYLRGNRYGAAEQVHAVLSAPSTPLSIHASLALLDLMLSDTSSRGRRDGNRKVRMGDAALVWDRTLSEDRGQVMPMMPCDMRCLSGTRASGDGGPACPVDMEEHRIRCIGWAMVQHVFSFAFAEEEPGRSGTIAEMLESMDRIGEMRQTPYRRLALVALARRAFVSKDPALTMLEGEMAKELLPVLSRGMERITQALLMRWLDDGGAFEDEDDESGEIEKARIATNALMTALGRMNNESMLSSLARGNRDRRGITSGSSDRLARDDGKGPRLIGDVHMMKGKMPVLYLRLLGGFEALIEGEPSTLDIWRRHNVRALLTLLMCRRGSELSRGSLFDALWPTSDESHARDSLYALLGALRKALKDTAVPDDFIIRTEDSMSVNHMVVDSDIFELIRLIRSVTSTYTRSPELLLDYARIDELYRGDLVDLDQYDESVGQARRWIRSMFVDAMTHASGLCRENGDPLATIWFARRAFEFGVGREDVFRCLMQAQMYNGQVNAAKETYEECRKYMFKEFGIPLSQETVDVYNELVIPVRRRKHVAGQLRGRGYGSADESRD